YDPKKEHDDEVQTVKDLQAAHDPRADHFAEAAQRASGAEARDLHPRRRTFGSQRALQKQLARFFTSQFATGCLRNSARGNELDTVRRHAKTARDLVGYRRGDGRAAFRISIE